MNNGTKMSYNRNRRHDVYLELKNIYWNFAPTIMMLSTCVGFSVSIFGELDDTSRMNSPIASFVNVVGYSFIGLFSGMCWPVAMPLLSIGAIYNRSGTPKICSK
jgi:hypothetical protein